MSTLVTGFGGYLGPVIVRALHDSGVAVVGLDAGWFLHTHAQPMDWPEEVAFADLRDPGDPIHDIDTVVHLAGLSNDPLGDLHPNLTERINYRATIDLIQQYPKARHVFISSCSVYGANNLAFEDSPTNPLTAYAKSKLAVDQWLTAQKLNAVSLRLGTVYGFSPGHRLDLAINAMVYDAVTGLPVTYNHGNPARPFVHIEDVASAVVWAANSKQTGIFNVVGENWRIKDVAYAIADFTKAITRADTQSAADMRNYMADASKLKQAGWIAQRSVRGSLPVLAEKSMALPPRAYRRLPALKRLLERGVLTTDLYYADSPRPKRKPCDCNLCEAVAA